MAEPRWTEAQKLAMETAGHDLLLTASAGSGKTAVLSRRCVYLLTESERPCDVDELLVMTFAEDAAAEMRTRIAQVLAERVARGGDDRLRRQLVLLDKASISTIHSFCSGLLREYFYLANVDPDYEVLDGHVAELLRRQVVEEVLEAAYEESERETAGFSGRFRRLVRGYGGRSDMGIIDLVLELDRFLQTLVDPAGWRAACRSELSAAENGGSLKVLALQRVVLVQQIEQIAQWTRSLAAFCEGQEEVRPYQDYLQGKIGTVIGDIQAALKNDQLETATALIQGFSFPRKPGVRNRSALGDFVFKQIDQIKDVYNKTAKTYALNPDEVRRQVVAGGDFVLALIELQERFQQQYEANKQNRNALDFSDLEHKALELLLDSEGGESEAARQQRARYRYLLVDEYQDISPVQEALIRAVCRTGQEAQEGNVFMVGDAKQSIYSFRQADAEIIQSKAAAFEVLTGEQAATGPGNIRLNENFRSRQTIIDGVNYVFSRCMTPSFGGIDYQGGEQLVYGASYYDASEGEQARPIEIHLLEKKAGTENEGESEGEDGVDMLDQTRREAMVAAGRIRALMGLDGSERLKVYDKKSGQLRPVEYRDMVVLLRSVRQRAELYSEVFHRMGIPVHAELGSGFLAAIEIRDMTHLMRLLDNPRQDIPLAAILRSPLVGMTETQLLAIRQAGGEDLYSACRQAAEGTDGTEWVERLKRFLERLERWRTAARQGRLGDLIWRIYHETHYPAWVAGTAEGRQRYTNLITFYEYACQFDRFSSQGLSRFLDFIDQLLEEGKDFGPAPVLSEADNVVRIMTVHKSKGLEFPVVILADMGKQFNLKGAGGSMVFDRADRGGIGLRWVDPVSRDSWPLLSYTLIVDQQRRRNLAEEMRIWYVAMTRAREYLIMTGSGSLEKLKETMSFCRSLGGAQLDDYILEKGRCLLDWLTGAIANHQAAAEFVGEAAGVGPLSSEGMFRLESYDGERLEGLMREAGMNGPQNEPRVDLDELGQKEADPMISERAKEIVDRIERPYAYQALTALPAKMSVSVLKQSRLRDDPADEQRLDPLVRGAESKRIEAILPRFMEGEEQPLSAAQVGTVTHLFMEKVDLTMELDRAGLRSQLVQMVKLKQMTEGEAGQVDMEQVERFFGDRWGRMMSAAPGRVMREWPFTLQLGANEIWREVEESQGVLVRGIIDCLIETNDGYVIVDYKTDRVTGDRVAERGESYRVQLELYQRAVEAILKVKVVEKVVYFLAAGQGYEID